MQPERTDCLIRNDIQFERTDYLNQGNELIIREYRFSIRGKELQNFVFLKIHVSLQGFRSVILVLNFNVFHNKEKSKTFDLLIIESRMKKIQIELNES